MQELQPRIVRLLPAAADSVAIARSSVAELAALAGAAQEEVDRVRLVVSEVVTNAVEHAYDGAPGRIKLKAALREGSVSVLIADDGNGLGASRQLGGLGVGLEIAERLSDAFNVLRRPSGGVEVRMRFDLLGESDCEERRERCLPDRRPGAAEQRRYALDFSARRN